MAKDDDRFDWSADNDDVVQHSVQGVAAYLNPRNQVVIRQEASYPDDNEDRWIVLTPESALVLSDRLKQLAADAKSLLTQ